VLTINDPTPIGASDTDGRSCGRLSVERAGRLGLTARHVRHRELHCHLPQQSHPVDFDPVPISLDRLEKSA